MQGMTVLAGAAALPSAWGADAIVEASRPVVTFYMDELIIDHTGKSPPYRPPTGFRSAAPVEHLSDAEVRWLQGWV
jgi:hypothetical protein